MAVDLLTDIRDYLVGQGLARKPAVPGAAPPLWLAPRNGVPAPNEGQSTVEQGDPVLGLLWAGGVPARPFESSLIEDVVDVWIRASNAAAARQTYRNLRAALIDRRNVQVGTQTAIDIEEWRPFQPLESGDQAFTFSWGLWVQGYST